MRHLVESTTSCRKNTRQKFTSSQILFYVWEIIRWHSKGPCPRSDSVSKWRHHADPSPSDSVSSQRHHVEVSPWIPSKISFTTCCSRRSTVCSPLRSKWRSWGISRTTSTRAIMTRVAAISTSCSTLRCCKRSSDRMCAIATMSVCSTVFPNGRGPGTSMISCSLRDSVLIWDLDHFDKLFNGDVHDVFTNPFRNLLLWSQSHHLNDFFHNQRLRLVLLRGVLLTALLRKHTRNFKDLLHDLRNWLIIKLLSCALGKALMRNMNYFLEDFLSRSAAREDQLSDPRCAPFCAPEKTISPSSSASFMNHTPRVLTVFLCLHACPGCRAAYAFPLLFLSWRCKSGHQTTILALPARHLRTTVTKIPDVTVRKKEQGPAPIFTTFIPLAMINVSIPPMLQGGHRKEGTDLHSIAAHLPSHGRPPLHWPRSHNTNFQNSRGDNHVYETKKRRNRYPSRRMLVCTLHTTTSFHQQSLIAPLSKHTQHTLSHHPSEWPTHGNIMFFPLDVSPLFDSSGIQYLCICSLFLSPLICHENAHKRVSYSDIQLTLVTAILPYVLTSSSSSPRLSILDFRINSVLLYLVSYTSHTCRFWSIQNCAISRAWWLHRPPNVWPSPCACSSKQRHIYFLLMKLLTGSNLKTHLQRVWKCQQCPISVLDVSYHVLLNIARTDMFGINIVLFNHQGTHLDYIMSSYSSSWCTASSSFSFYAPYRCFEDLSFPHRLQVFIPLPFPARLSPEKPPQVHGEPLDHSLPRRCFMCMRFLTRNLRSPPPDL